MKNQQSFNWKNTVFGILMIVLVIAMLIVSYSVSGMNYEESSKATYVTDGWKIIFEDKEYENVNIEQFRFDHKLSEGEEFTLYGEIPYGWNYDMPVLVVNTDNSTISVTVGDNTVYLYGQDKYNNKELVGGGTHYIKLNQADKGKRIKIKIMSTEYRSFSKIDQIKIANYSDAVNAHMTKYRVVLATANFLLMFGFIVMLIAGIVYIQKQGMVRIFWIGMLSVSVGTWSICYYDIIHLFGVSITVSTYLEYLSLYIGTVPTLMYFKDYVEDLKKGYLKTIFRSILIAQIVFIIVATLFNIFDIMHYPTLRTGLHLFVVVEMLFIAVVMVMMIRKGSISARLISIGFLIAIISMFVDMGEYILFERLGNIIEFQGISAVGMAVFISILMLAFMLDIAHKLKTNTEKEVLYRMAYTDELTKINNRRYCEECLETLAASKEEYGIINIDLNDLKKINDTMGHDLGDELIAGFAAIIKNTFGEKAVVGRMGGDEFIIIIENLNDINVESLMVNLHYDIEAANKKQDKFKYSIAYGFASSKEISLSGGVADYRQVYKLADERMYEMKREKKLAKRDC